MRLFTKIEKVLKIDNAKSGAMARKERLAKGIALRQMAKRVGLSPSYICDLEHGKRGWSFELEHVFNSNLR